jgi:glyoxylase-like metal-dependent hydrolase (beta-lactamase superfamily II)
VPEKPLTVTYLGHAAVLIELDGVRVLTDPVLRRRVMHLRRLVAKVQAAEVGKLDGILVSHLHFDHFDPGTLKRFDRHIRVVVPRGGAVSYLERRGFHRRPWCRARHCGPPGVCEGACRTCQALRVAGDPRDERARAGIRPGGLRVCLLRG